ncbi:ATP-dependent nuclease [Methylobacterium marchantiae]|uniref:ATP-dependent endonuclease n=1 Tax=Methylobacterium marchantiae TaxID=600331 RepID=A0ABW3X3G6_9HYPH|nr:DNA replication and repair protein RecF [Methylobacterium marchantiae]
MKLERLTIQNFRCFGPEPSLIKFHEGVTAFVGNNGSGKTAIFAALGRLFGVSTAQRSVVRSDFHAPPDLDEVASGAKLVIDCVLGFPHLGEGEDDAAVPEVFSHMGVSGPGEPLRVRIRLEATWTDDTTPGGVVEEDIRWISSFDNEYDWARCRRVAALERSLIQLVYVPANRNAFDQVTSLLKGRLWRAARWSGGMSEAASATAGELQARFDAEAPSRFIIERLERRWNQVHRGDSAARPVLRLVENRLEDLVRQAEFVFLPDASGQARHLHDLSDGQRSLFHIALTAATLEMERDAFVGEPTEGAFDQERLRRTYLTLLVIEEPENSLSPFFLSRIMTQAREIGAMDGAQVVVSSHSPSILARVEPEEVRYARLNPRTGISHIRELNLPDQQSEASKFVRLAVKAYPELYFARYVVLAEGESEAIILPRLAEAMGVPLDKSFVPVVPLGGRFVTHFWRLLESLQIPYATLLDLDLGRQHGGGKAIEKIVQELGAVGRSLEGTWEVVIGDIDLDRIDEIDDARLLDDGDDNDWLTALREKDVYFSFPIDIDFAMIQAFPDVYMRTPEGKRGPRNGPGALTEKKATTLKTNGDVALYDEDETYDNAFVWYPYLFLGASKPGAHLAALGLMDEETLRTGAPEVLVSLVEAIRAGLPA